MTGSIVPVLAAPVLDPGQARVFLEVPHGLTVAEIVAKAMPGPLPAPDALRVALVSDQGVAIIPHELWSKVRPNPGVQVVIRTIPTGDALKSVLLIVVSAAALALAGPIAAGLGLGAIGTSLVAAGLTVLGTLLVNALIPPPTPDDTRREDRYTVSGWRNQARPGEPVPLVLGKHRYAPPFAASSWTEVVGGQQYVRAMFCVGYGPVRISDIRIGEASIDDFDDITVEVREGRAGDQPLTLYRYQVVEETMGVEVIRPREPGDDGVATIFSPSIPTPIRRWTGGDTSQIALIFSLPSGLVRINDEGKLRSRTVSVRIRARLNGVGAWTTITTLKIWGKTRSPFLRRYVWNVPTRGRWQVEVQRQTDDPLDASIADQVVLAAIQSIRPEYPLNMDTPVALIAMRVRASYQLNGALQSVNCIVEREGLVRDGDAWVSGYGRTPATAFLTALMGPSNPFPVTEAEIDMDQIADWHDWCVAKGLKYDFVHDRSDSLGQVLAMICAAGRATYRHDGLRWGVVIDRPQELVVDHINPRNSKNFEWSRTYFEPPEGMRVTFLDETNNYEVAERIIPWPGNDGPVNLTEELELPGKTDPDEIWVEARRRMYELIHRPDAFSAIQDGASRVATRGDLVMGSFDVLEETQTSARVKSTSGNAVVLDEAVVIPEEYGLRFRVYADPDDVIGISLVRPLVPNEMPSQMVQFATAGDMPAPGEVVHIGPVLQESLGLRVRGIEPAEDFASRVVLVAAAPQIDTLTDAEVPPQWDGRVGADVAPTGNPPAAPIVVSLTAGTAEDAGANAVEVLLREGGGSPVRADTFEVDHRILGGTIWTTLSFPVADGGTLIEDYDTNDVIEVRARGIADGVAGPHLSVVTFDIGTGIATAPPNVPDGAVVLTPGVGTVEVAITANADPETDAFRVFRVPTNALVDRAVHGVSPLLSSTPFTTVTFNDTATAGTYDYYVEAVNDVGEFGNLAGPFTTTAT